MSRLVVAHHLGTVFGDLMEARVPANVDLVALPAADPWTIPPDARVLYTMPPRQGVLPAPVEAPSGWPGNLAWVHTASAGVDEYPRWMLNSVPVTCARGVTSDAIAEFAFAALLSHEKRMPEIWIDSPADWRRIDLGGLHDRTLGLLGFGSIGEAIARRAAAFGMRVLAHRRTPANGTDGVTVAPLETVLAEADHLVLALPLTPATRHVLNRRTLALTKPGVHVVNISRGGLIDQPALIEALDRGQVGFATLDVAEPEPLPEGHILYRHPRVRISPHVSWASPGFGEKLLAMFLDNLDRFIAGQPLLNRVDAAAGY